jgi:hypothetical protein
MPLICWIAEDSVWEPTSSKHCGTTRSSHVQKALSAAIAAPQLDAFQPELLQYQRKYNSYNDECTHTANVTPEPQKLKQQER